MEGMWTEHPASFTTDVERIRSDYPAFPPGLVYAYSNLGVTLLGHAVQNTAGQDFAP